MKSRWLRDIFIVLIVLCFAGVGIYYGVPALQPCARLAQILPLGLLPPNPNVADLTFEPLPNARAITGEYACAGYRIEVPDSWNGDLVVYAHGFRAGAVTDLFVTDLPVRDEAIHQGFAWAASTYRANGYNPLDGIEDTRLMIEQFKQRVGVPKRIFIYGSSMGGHAVVGSLEKYPDLYAGGVAECGAVGGAGQFDDLIAANTLADYFAGTDLFAPENKGLQAQLALVKTKLYPALGAPPDFHFDENAIFGNNDPAPQVTLTPKGKAFRNALIYVGGGHRPFAEEGFGGAYALTVLAPRAIYGLLPGLLAVGTTTDMQYQIDAGFGVDATALNAGVPRIPADPVMRAKYAFTGHIKVPLLTIHDTGDLFVPISNERVLRRLMNAAGNGNHLVQRAVRRFLHCDFSIQERNRAFNDLIAWVNTGIKPEGEDLLGPLDDVGKKWTEPLRPDDPGHP